MYSILWSFRSSEWIALVSISIWPSHSYLGRDQKILPFSHRRSWIVAWSMTLIMVLTMLTLISRGCRYIVIAWISGIFRDNIIIVVQILRGSHQNAFEVPRCSFKSRAAVGAGHFVGYDRTDNGGVREPVDCRSRRNVTVTGLECLRKRTPVRGFDQQQQRLLRPIAS